MNLQSPWSMHACTGDQPFLSPKRESFVAFRGRNASQPAAFCLSSSLPLPPTTEYLYFEIISPLTKLLGWHCCCCWWDSAMNHFFLPLLLWRYVREGLRESESCLSEFISLDHALKPLYSLCTVAHTQESSSQWVKLLPAVLQQPSAADYDKHSLLDLGVPHHGCWFQE